MEKERYIEEGGVTPSNLYKSDFDELQRETQPRKSTKRMCGFEP